MKRKPGMEEKDIGRERDRPMGVAEKGPERKTEQGGQKRDEPLPFLRLERQLFGKIEA